MSGAIGIAGKMHNDIYTYIGNIYPWFW